MTFLDEVKKNGGMKRHIEKLIANGEIVPENSSLTQKRIDEWIATISDSNKHFWLSIRKAKNCLFGRRYGHSGKRILGYSIRLRLFNKDII